MSEKVTSRRYLRIQVDIEHDEDVTAEELINESDYNITLSTDNAEITHLDMLDIDEDY